MQSVEESKCIVRSVALPQSIASQNIYFYLSNETLKEMEVYFDDPKITHRHSPVIQTDDYYPFGLTFNSSEISGYISNNFLYNPYSLKCFSLVQQ